MQAVDEEGEGKNQPQFCSSLFIMSKPVLFRIHIFQYSGLVWFCFGCFFKEQNQ